jgi:hypothetical protein
VAQQQQQQPMEQLPTNLQFPDRYGAIVRTLWHDDGTRLLVGFTSGWLVCLSAVAAAGDYIEDAVGQELFSVQVLRKQTTKDIY